MKRYLKDFKLTYEFVKGSVYECLSRQRWTRRDTSYMLAEYAKLYCIEHNIKIKNFDKLAKKIRETAYKDRTKLYKLVDYMCLKFYEEISNKSINLKPIRYEKRIDQGSGKERDIGISTMKQQCFDYIAVNACLPMFKAKIGHYQCASLPNRGQIFGKRAIETWIRTNPKKCRYVFKCDVKKFYPSVSHERLKEYLRRDIKNETVIYLVSTLIDTYKQGLCIGSYLSQYLANYYLSYAYHFIKENLYTYRRNKRINYVNYALFYMDDIILFGSSKKNLKIASKKLQTFLRDKLKLELKTNYQLFPLDTRNIDMMGFRIYTYKTTIRKRIFNRMNKVLSRIKRNAYRVSLKEAQKIIAYYGYLKHSFSHKYQKKMKVERIFELSKEVISKHAKSYIFV